VRLHKPIMGVWGAAPSGVQVQSAWSEGQGASLAVFSTGIIARTASNSYQLFGKFEWLVGASKMASTCHVPSSLGRVTESAASSENIIR